MVAGVREMSCSLLQVVMEYVGGGSVSSLLRNPDCGPVRGEVREDRNNILFHIT